jgi:hypothetical protein
MTNQTKSNSCTINQKPCQDVCPTKCEDNKNTNTDKGNDVHNENKSIDLTKLASVIVQETQVKKPTDKQCKKSKKKKKKKKQSAYKKFLKSAKQSRYTEEEKRQIEHDKIKKLTGGGKFTRIRSI